MVAALAEEVEALGCLRPGIGYTVDELIQIDLQPSHATADGQHRFIHKPKQGFLVVFLFYSHGLSLLPRSKDQNRSASLGFFTSAGVFE